MISSIVRVVSGVGVASGVRAILGVVPHERRSSRRAKASVVGLCLVSLAVACVAAARPARGYPLSTDVAFGGFYGNGGEYSLPSIVNLVAHPPAHAESRDRVGAYITNGSHVAFPPATTISVRDNAIGETIGIVAGAGAHVSFPAGAGVEANESAIGDSIGLVAEYDSLSAIRGSFTLTEAGNGSTFGIHAEDAATVEFSGSVTATEDGNGNAVGVFARDSATVHFSGVMNLFENGNGDALPFHLIEGARLVSTGSFVVAELGNSSRAGALVAGSASARLDGGAISIRSDGNAGQPPALLELADAAVVRIGGGVYQVLHREMPVTPLIAVNGEAELRIAGRGFDRPLGAIDETAGEIAGLLADGQPFRFAFTRAAGASIVLVPEASVGALALVGGAAAAATLRRSLAVGRRR